MRISLLLLALFFLPFRSWAGADIPVAGTFLALFASADLSAYRGASVLLRDRAIGAPFADPRAGARLVVSGGAGEGQCWAEIPLHEGIWEPLQGDGATHGWGYRAPADAPGGVRRIAIRPGSISIRAGGELWPCDLASEQRLPVYVRLVVDGDRYCAAFGGDIRANRPGWLYAQRSAAPQRCADKDDVTVANLNILHGLGCGDDFCRFSDRVSLFYQWVVDAGCPDVVTVQEVFATTVTGFDAGIADACPFAYTAEHLLDNTFDDVLVLSRYPIVHSEVAKLHNAFRNIAFVRIDHPVGPVDVFSTHLAAGIDGANQPCGDACPAECIAAGAATVRQCQSVQAADFVASRHTVSTPAFLTGDFNAQPDEYEYLHIISRGWSDTYVAAGNPADCNPVSGVGCGSGRSSTLADLESTALTVDERIDYIFLVPPANTDCALDSPQDADADGTATNAWADAANPFAAACGPAPLPVCWPSDHNGNQADLNCR